MTYSYFPGCTLSTKGKALDSCGRCAAAALGIELRELDEWQCCGAVYPQAKDEIATKLSAVRALNAAKERGEKLVTLCSACHHVLKRVNDDMRHDDYIRSRANNYLKLPAPYAGETEVVHYLEVLRDDVGFDAVKRAVTHPLKGRKIAAYYGCLLLRPASVLNIDDPENPTILENLIRALGAEAVVYGQRNECCGGYMAMEQPGLAAKRSQAVLDSAMLAGAELIVTACPLCLYNLKKHIGDRNIEVRYFTEILAEALGEGE